jgi:membrane-bound lytic murein transglycosylase D
MSRSGQTIIKKALVIKLKVLRGEANQKEFSFSEPFCIGREETCQVRLQDSSVSRMHVEGYLREDCWWIRDLNSANGTLVEGRKIDRLPLTKPTIIELGVDGPILSFEPEAVRPTQATIQKNIPSVTEYQKRYFDKSGQGEMGEHTLFVRQAFQRVQRKQKGKYYAIIGSVAVLLVLASGYAYLQHKKVREQIRMAVGLFYDMKTLELGIAGLKSKLQALGTEQDLNEIRKYESSLQRMTLNYEEFVKKLGVYRKDTSQEEKLIIKMARVFGECELQLPEGFVTEVQKYITEWKSSNRLSRAIQRAKERGYDSEISYEMLKYGLPAQFFYLAIQESDLDPNRCGPETRFGFAKGMWQFIPDTALDYGLRIGPFVDYPRYDPRDERHDFRKSTQAAARYIRDLYDRDAQASGLLVMASYNWSETRVREFIRTMPENPRERNFWLLLEKYVSRIPDETYNYIFRIFSAAVIGENPRLFGFDFDNPLGHISELK